MRYGCHDYFAGTVLFRIWRHLFTAINECTKSKSISLLLKTFHALQDLIHFVIISIWLDQSNFIAVMNKNTINCVLGRCKMLFYLFRKYYWKWKFIPYSALQFIFLFVLSLTDPIFLLFLSIWRAKFFYFIHFRYGVSSGTHIFNFFTHKNNIKNKETGVNTA